MSKFLVLLSLIFGCSFAQAYDMDLTGGRAEVFNSQELLLRNVKFGNNSAVWAKLVWNSKLNAFELIDFGDDGDNGQAQSMRAIVGTWTMYFDWSCRGNTSSATWTLYEDGRCVDSQNNACVWSYRKSEFTLNYGQNIGALYRGTLDRDGNTLRGTMSYQTERGCWTGVRSSSPMPQSKPTPRAPLKPVSPVRP